jgi:hypothetical protein
VLELDIEILEAIKGDPNEEAGPNKEAGPSKEWSSKKIRQMPEANFTVWRADGGVRPLRFERGGPNKEGGWLGLEDPGMEGGGPFVRLVIKRSVSTALGMSAIGRARAHANNVLATPRLLWCLHNNLAATSVLRLVDRRTGKPRRSVRLGGPNCHNPLFYRGQVL